MTTPKPWLALGMALPLVSCDLLYPKDLVYIEQTDRPIRSASFRTCGKDFALKNADGYLQTTIHVPTGCDGNLDVVMAEGDELTCHVGDAPRSGWHRRFLVKNDRCTGVVEIPLQAIRPES